MDPKERELRQQLAAKKEAARKLVEEGKIDEARSLITEAETISAKIEAYRSLEGIETPPVDPDSVKEPGDDEERKADTSKEYRSAYEKYLKFGRNAEMSDEERAAFKAKQNEARSMNEGEKGSGGILVPEDDSKDIILQKKSKTSIRNLVGVKPVGTLSGSRPKRRGTDLKMKNYDEKTKIDKMDTPQYEEIKYKVHKYGGIFEATNELIADSAVSISTELLDWYTEISLNTENDEVFYGIGGENSTEGIFTTTKYRTLPTPTSGVDIKLLRKLKNMVDAGYRRGAKWVMNTAATEALADMKYADGKSVLVPDPTQADVFTLFSYPVAVFDDIKTETGKTKIAFGNFEVGYYFFDRKTLEAKTTDEGGDAFENDTTLTRIIQRFDGKPANEDAIVILTGVPVEA
ncbi:phage major capsid protein [Paenibacillus ottowii]|uniref:Phage major capsid protein n=1 Tax=Paenibacillus ottowii TaxID=2315729 RepID=A0ABY3BAI1_9BACL|nr:phage major capsid protein [Paenibacillus ottowii]TQS01365.1 phage major capsid protein [Paenibacillus ottowii]TQS01420.1 phage major capsid protein [Paenibacillus ottowii]